MVVKRYRLSTCRSLVCYDYFASIIRTEFRLQVNAIFCINKTISLAAYSTGMQQKSSIWRLEVGKRSSQPTVAGLNSVAIAIA